MMTVGRVAANYPALGDKRDEWRGEVEDAYIIVRLVLGPIHLQSMCVCDFLALNEQVGAQCDSVLGAQCEVLVNQSILGWNIDVCADFGVYDLSRRLKKKTDLYENREGMRRDI
jgi:hypothetical protein